MTSRDAPCTWHPHARTLAPPYRHNAHYIQYRLYPPPNKKTHSPKNASTRRVSRPAPGPGLGRASQTRSRTTSNVRFSPAPAHRRRTRGACSFALPRGKSHRLGGLAVDKFCTSEVYRKPAPRALAQKAPRSAHEACLAGPGTGRQRATGSGARGTCRNLRRHAARCGGLGAHAAARAAVGATQRNATLSCDRPRFRRGHWTGPWRRGSGARSCKLWP